jgi:hypothetical protein
MRKGILRTACLLTILGTAMPAFTQEAHPLVGSWTGDWGPSEDHRNHVVLVLDWDGSEITGTLNPGPEALPLTSATLDPSVWTVRFEAEATDFRGDAIHYVIEGVVEDLGSPNRRIVGSWSHESARGDFRVARQ